MSAEPLVASWSVVVPLPVGAYDFGVPHGHVGPVPVGCRVLVPWQGELRVGLVLGAGRELGHRLRDAVVVLDDSPWVSPAFLVALAQEAAVSRVPLGLLVSDLVGVGLEPVLSHRVRAVPDADLTAFGVGVPGAEWQDAGLFGAALLDRIREQGLLEEDLRVAARTVGVFVAHESAGTDLTPKQRGAWGWLREHGPCGTLSAWAAGAGVSAGVVTGVVTRGWAARVEVPAPPPELPAPAVAPRVAPDRAPEADVWRLHGGRPSQRYRVLAARVARALDIGRSVVVVVPDHACLRRAWEGLSGVQGDLRGVAVQFSGALSAEAREYAWALVRSGEARLVVGTHAALCAPLHDPALVVIDEDGSDAHKLMAGSQVWVPAVARRMAQEAGCVLAYTGSVPAAEVLGAEGLVLPPPRARVHVVDYAAPAEQPELGPLSSPHLKLNPQGYPLSHDLVKVLRQVAERGRQAVLLAPRRGYSALLRCPSCEHTPSCVNCDVPLRFHQEGKSLTCHQCGYHERLHERCVKCGERMWQAKGPGTEWIAQEVRKVLPGFPVLRFDRDHQDDLSGVHAGGSGVVVGTQALLSQGAPPDLALVGVTLADTWLNVSDFRASERYHRMLRQLLEWHPERAPLLVVQTFQARHPALVAVADGLDAEAYVRQEAVHRRALRYPPFARLAQVEVSARDQGRALAAAQKVALALQGRGATADELLGPAPSPVARLRGAYPYHLLLRVRDDARLAQLLVALDGTFGGRVRVDVHPRGSMGLA